MLGERIIDAWHEAIINHQMTKVIDDAIAYRGTYRAAE
jgi:hypothetical protein